MVDWKKIVTVILLILLGISLVGLSSAAVDVTTCRDINTSETYILQNNLSVSASSACLNVTTNDTIIDGNGYWINGAGFTASSTVNDTGGFGVYIDGNDAGVANLKNITITNLGFYNLSRGYYPETNYVEDVVIKDSRFTNNEYGVSLDTAHFYSHNVSNSTFRDISLSGVDFSALSDNSIINRIFNNTFINSSYLPSFSGVFDPKGVSEGAILLRELYDYEVYNNIFINNTGPNSTAIVFLGDFYGFETQKIYNNIFDNNNYSLGIQRDNYNVEVYDNKIISSGGTYDIWVGDDFSNNVNSAYITNLTGFNNNINFMFGTGQVDIYWRTIFNVIDQDTSNPIVNVLILIYDILSNLVTSGLTNSTGDNSTLTAREYRYNTTGKFFDTPHTINFTNTNYFYNETSYNLSSPTPVYCLQETANITPSCGGYNSGTYTVSGWNFTGQLYDGDDGTGGVCVFGDFCLLHINYTTPSYYISGTKWGISNGQSVHTTTNVTLLDSCVSGNVQLRYNASNIDSSARVECFNSSGWQNLGSIPFVGDTLYEEKIFWNIAEKNVITTITMEIASPTITLQTPADTLNTTKTTPVFSANLVANNGILKNTTLYIWSSTGLEYSNSNTSLTGTDQNVSWEVPLSTKDYTWNIEAWDNTGLQKISSNRTIRIYEGEFSFKNLFENRTIKSQNGFASFNIDEQNNNFLKYCNYTVVHPLGNILVDNVNASKNSTGQDFFGNKFTHFVSPSWSVNDTRAHNATVNCTDRFGTNLITFYNITPTYNMFYSPTNISFAAVTTKSEHNNFTITAYDETDNTIIFDITTAIANSGNFTITTPTTIRLNASDNSTNPATSWLNLNASATIANGSYVGNVTLSNSTYNITKVVHFTYGISPPSGIPTIQEAKTGVACNTSATGNCAVVEQGLKTGDTEARIYQITNTGAFALTNCNADYSLDLDGNTFIDSSISDFTLAIGESKNITLSATLTGVNPGYGSYQGYFSILCLDGDLGGSSVSSSSSNTPYFNFVLNQEVVGGGGGGGGGTRIIRPANWTMRTDSNTMKYSFAPAPGDSRDRELIFENKGNKDVELTLRCDGDLCEYIILDKTSLNLPVARDITTSVGININYPIDIEGGKYITNLIARDLDGSEEIVTIETTIGSGPISTFTSNVSGDIDILGISIPNLVISLVLFIASSFGSFAVFFRNSKNGGTKAILTGLTIAVFYLFLSF